MVFNTLPINPDSRKPFNLTSLHSLPLFPSILPPSIHIPYLYYRNGGNERELSIAQFMDIYQEKTREKFIYTNNLWKEPTLRLPPLTASYVKLTEAEITQRAAFKETAMQLLRNDAPLLRTLFPDESPLPPTFREKIYIAYINEKVGFGLFARRDIKEGEYLGIVASDVIPSPDFTSRYVIEMGEMSDLNPELALSFGNRANFLSFLQHLPYKPLRKQRRAANSRSCQNKDWHYSTINCRDDLKEKIATENVCLVGGYIDDVPVLLAQATVDIKADTIIGTDYGPTRWLDKRPELFFCNGEIVPQENYKNTEFVVFYNNVTLEFVSLGKEDFVRSKLGLTDVYLETANRFISHYDLQQRCVDNNVLPPCYNKLPLTKADETLKEFLDFFYIEMRHYKKHPETTQPELSAHIDCVLRAPSLIALVVLQKFVLKAGLSDKRIILDYLNHQIIIRRWEWHPEENRANLIRLLTTHLKAKLARIQKKCSEPRRLSTEEKLKYANEISDSIKDDFRDVPQAPQEAFPGQAVPAQ